MPSAAAHRRPLPYTFHENWTLGAKRGLVAMPLTPQWTPSPISAGASAENPPAKLS